MRKISVRINEDKNVSCNCCNHSENNKDDLLYVIKFKMGNMDTVVRLCERHFIELQNEIRDNF